jgi:hypothetical protein
LFASGFEYNGHKIKALTCFECFEHFDNPIEELEKMLSISHNIFFSTTLKGNNAPEVSWEYYGFNHGQHISFYSLKTLEYLAKKYNLNLYTNRNNLHLFLDKKVNKFKIRLLLKLGALPWDMLCRFILRSKTLDDNRFIINESAKHD